MDPEKRDGILKKLYADTTFANLPNIRSQLEYILVKHFDCPEEDEQKEADEAENQEGEEEAKEKTSPREIWLNSFLDTVESRLQAWNETVNRKSYKTAKKLRATARKTLELLAKLTDFAGTPKGSRSKGPKGEVEKGEERGYLRRAEHYLSKAILAAPYAATEAIASDMDKVAALKFSLYAERAQVRFRLGAIRQAASDASMALHCADALETPAQAEPALALALEDVKVLAIRCFAALNLIDAAQAEEVIDFITFSKSAYTYEKEVKSEDGDGAEDANKKDTAAHKAASLLEQLIEMHGEVSNFSTQNAPTLGGFSGESYFRYQVDRSAIQIKEAQHKGRYFIASKAIKSGAWLLVEKPYSSVVHKSYLANTCNFCLQDLKELKAKQAEESCKEETNSGEGEDEYGLGYPCDYCKEARYCSLNCAEEAYTSYHRHECGFLGFLLEAGPLAGVHTYRILAKTGLGEAIAYWRARNSASTSYSVGEYLEEAELRTKGDWASLSPDERQLLFRMSTSLAVHREAYTASWTAWHALQALDTVLILLSRNRRLLMEQGEDTFSLLLDTFELSLEQVRRIAVNVFGKFDYKPAKKANIATGQIFVGSLVNHSCAPNVDWSWSAGHILFKANRDIGQGEELNVTYGQTKSSPFQDRQDALQHYHFLCGCRLCRSDLAGTEEELIARCQACDKGPLVCADTNAGCLDCYAKTTPSAVRAALADLSSARTNLAWQAKMLATSASILGTSNRKEQQLKATVLPVLQTAETSLRSHAFRGSVSFSSTLRQLASLYLQLGERSSALALSPLAEEAEVALSSLEPVDPSKGPEKRTWAEMENKLAEYAFWTEVGRQYFLAGQTSSGKEGGECSKEKYASLKLYIRYLKLAIAYIEQRTGSVRGKLPSSELTVGVLLEDAAYSDAKLVYMLAEQKKAELMAILG